MSYGFTQKFVGWCKKIISNILNTKQVKLNLLIAFSIKISSRFLCIHYSIFIACYCNSGSPIKIFNKVLHYGSFNYRRLATVKRISVCVSLCSLRKILWLLSVLHPVESVLHPESVLWVKILAPIHIPMPAARRNESYILP